MGAGSTAPCRIVESINTKPTRIFSPLKLLPCLLTPYREIVHLHQTNLHIHIVVKFFQNVHVECQLVRGSVTVDTSIYIRSAGERIYGFKAKKATRMKVERMMFKKQMESNHLILTEASQSLERLDETCQGQGLSPIPMKHQKRNDRCTSPANPNIQSTSGFFMNENFLQHLPTHQTQSSKISHTLECLVIFCELKLLSLLGMGSKIYKFRGVTDGIIDSGNRIQFYGQLQVAINHLAPNQSTELIDRYKAVGFKINPDEWPQHYNYSPLRRCFRLRAPLVSQAQSLIGLDSQRRASVSPMSNPNIKSTKPIGIILRQFEDDVLNTLGSQDCQLFAIWSSTNLLANRQVKSAMDKFKRLGLESYHNIWKLIGELGEDFLNVVELTPYGEKLGTNKEIGGTQQNYQRKRNIEAITSPSRNTIKPIIITPLAYLAFGLSFHDINQYINQLNSPQSTQQHSNQPWLQGYNRCLLQLQQGRPRWCITLLMHQLTKYTNHHFAKLIITQTIARIYHSYGQHKKAYNYFQQSLLIHLQCQMRCQLTAYTLNNAAIQLFMLRRNKDAVQLLQKGFTMVQLSPETELILRINLSISLLQCNRKAQARSILTKFSQVQLCLNMFVLCRYFSCLGYLEFIDKNYQKSLQLFEQASTIQQTFLMPNGHPTSLFLHNNFALCLYRLKQYKRAAIQIEVLKDRIEYVNDRQAFQIHYNFGKIFSQAHKYNDDQALFHFNASRQRLHRIRNSNSMDGLAVYAQQIDREITRIRQNKIQQCSQQSSNGARYDFFGLTSSQHFKSTHSSLNRSFKTPIDSQPTYQEGLSSIAKPTTVGQGVSRQCQERDDGQYM